VSEYYGVMIGQAPQTDKIAGDDIFRGYSIARRDKAPLIETEDFRDEAARGIWDDYSPPHFGFKPPMWSPVSAAARDRAATPTTGIPRRSASPPPRATTSYVRNRIDNPDPAHSKWSAYASIYWSDSDADGRQGSSEVCA
jgi:beta-galactosidase